MLFPLFATFAVSACLPLTAVADIVPLFTKLPTLTSVAFTLPLNVVFCAKVVWPVSLAIVKAVFALLFPILNWNSFAPPS